MCLLTRREDLIMYVFYGHETLQVMPEWTHALSGPDYSVAALLDSDSIQFFSHHTSL